MDPILDEQNWPRTLDDAVALILADMGDDEKRIVRAVPRDQLWQAHMGWGMGIRNSFGLWAGNTALLESSGCLHPDECSAKIIERVWEALHADTAPEGAGQDTA